LPINSTYRVVKEHNQWNYGSGQHQDEELPKCPCAGAQNAAKGRNAYDTFGVGAIRVDADAATQHYFWQLESRSKAISTHWQW
jgi:hypothetical protein